MTEWGIDTLFNPGKRHMDEEKRRLQSTREEIGDSSGGKRIDLESGVVRIARKNSETDEPETDAPEADEPEADQLETDQPEADQPEADQPEADQLEADQPETDQPETDNAGTTAPTSGSAAERARARRSAS
jgi:hypothetical protein